MPSSTMNKSTTMISAAYRLDLCERRAPVDRAIIHARSTAS